MMDHKVVKYNTNGTITKKNLSWMTKSILMHDKQNQITGEILQDNNNQK